MGSQGLIKSPSSESVCFELHRELRRVETVAVFTIDGEPVSKARARFTKKGSKVVSYTPEKTRNAEEIVAWKFRAAAPDHVPDSTREYGIFGVFFAGTRQRRDVDNMIKLICDGLNGVAWADDVQVVEVSGRRGIDVPLNARTEVWVYRLGTMQTGPTLSCVHCGSTFQTYESWARRKYCTRDCATAANRARRMRTCEHCGVNFDGVKVKYAPKYCSVACKSAARSVDVDCAVCGSTTHLAQSIAAQRAPICGSSECRATYWREQRKSAAKGVCSTCAGPTSKKSYTNCRPCSVEVRKKENATTIPKGTTDAQLRY